MTRWNLIVCFGGGTWMGYVRKHPSHIKEKDVHQSLEEEFSKDGEDVRFIGTHHTENID
jgi:hypothetical protein